MVNTYDVHFYASWALAMLWPLLELSVQRDFAAFTLVEYPDKWMTLHSSKEALRKVAGAVPHDLGNPGDDPWYKVNSYNIQPINAWKDLNCKFVLQVYRDYVLTGHQKFLWDCFPTCRLAIEYVARFDTDGDGLIENQGFPDQTYDTWAANGASAYSGGLWLTALSAMAVMCQILGKEDEAEQYKKVFEKGRMNYHAKLWNNSGGYFNYDTSDNVQHDSIMTDAMCGQWWARACNLPSIADDFCIQSTLKNIHKFNVMGFKNGQLGPVNGMRPDGKPDPTCMQSVEVWTGTGYGAAACMMQEGLVQQGFDTARGIIKVTYETVGYMFQTPEAWDSEGHYRAIGYMRPLAIWGMQYAWEKFAKCHRAQPDTTSVDPVVHRIDPNVWKVSGSTQRNSPALSRRGKKQKRGGTATTLSTYSSVPQYTPSALQHSTTTSSLQIPTAVAGTQRVTGGSGLAVSADGPDRSSRTLLNPDVSVGTPQVMSVSVGGSVSTAGSSFGAVELEGIEVNTISETGSRLDEVREWLKNDIRLPVSMVNEYMSFLTGDNIGVASMDDVRFLDNEMLTEAGIRPIHRKKILSWLEAHQE